MDRRLGDIDSSEQLINDLYIDLRRRINTWAAITKQTAQARMGYVGQHLVSIVTGYPGGRSGARGKDLIISATEYGEIKTCYRVDQLGKCKICGSVVAAIEQECPECNAREIQRNDDSKWLLSIRNEDEYSLIIEPTVYFLVLFDFTDLNDPHTIRASIWEVNPKRPGFAYCMIDYHENIREKSVSKAPFNLWPFQLKFDLMCPRLIYRSFISNDDTVTTQIFPGRDEPKPISEFTLSPYARARNLTIPKLHAYARNLGIAGHLENRKSAVIRQIEEKVIRSGIPVEEALDALAVCIYWPDIAERISTLPTPLIDHLRRAALID